MTNLNKLFQNALRHSRSGNFYEAKKILLKILKDLPDEPAALTNLGLVELQLNNINAFIAHTERSLNFNKNQPEALFNLALAFKRLGYFDRAYQSFSNAIILDPNYIKAMLARGLLLYELNNFDLALEDYNKAISLNPNYIDAYINRGAVLNNLACFDLALEDYNKAISLNPNLAIVYYNRARNYYDLRLYKESLNDYDKAIDLNPNYASAQANKSLLLISMGNFKEGWKLHEWRWKDQLKIDVRNYDKPYWLGEKEVKGKNILIYCEQGLGDTIQFCRYIVMLEKLGAKIFFEVPKDLISIIQTLKCKIQIIEKGRDLPSFDFHCSLMSLPYAFRTNIHDIPNDVPYLFSENNKKNSWLKRLKKNKLFKVGLVWSGGIGGNNPQQFATRKRRNMPLIYFEGFKKIKNVSFYSLQKGKFAESELKILKEEKWAGPEIIDFSCDLFDFSDTAALIENMDLVISVDTSTAHLSGAMNKKTWILNRFDNCWRWFNVDRDFSPWYPSVRLFKQPKAGDWKSVVDEVCIELERIIKSTLN